MHDVDAALDAEVELHCLGGFVLTVCYGMPRATKDIDCWEVVPRSRLDSIQQIAGESSRLARKHRVHIQYSQVGTLPEDYAERLSEIPLHGLNKLRLLGLDPYDLALSKLERNAERDRDDVRWLARAIPLEANVLRERYKKELRPYLANEARHDLTLRLWLEDLFPNA
ncbi:MAG: DUF6036 family nucleotidyltransferase [Candidatus Acidiferrales bacterium]